MKKRYIIKYRYKKARMSFCFYADNELDALKQFLYQAERFNLPVNSSVNLYISLDKTDYEGDLYE